MINACWSEPSAAKSTEPDIFKPVEAIFRRGIRLSASPLKRNDSSAVPASPVSAVLSTSAVMFTASAAVALPEHSARVIAIVLVADPAIDRKCVVAPVPMIAAAE